MTRVVIIGGGITGLAAAWELQKNGVDYTLLEASERLGGKIQTEHVDGFILEGAADSFLGQQKPWAWQFCQELGLTDRMIGTNDQQRNVYVLQDGRLQLMPRGMRLIIPADPDGLLESQLLTEEGKQRMLAEVDVPPRSEQGDESLGSFIRRRFGQEALDVFGEPLLAGIYVGNPETLSMQATFPNYLKMEEKYGSLINGFHNTPTPSPTPDMPKTVFVSFRNGMSDFIEGIRAKLTGEIRLNQKVTGITADKVVQLASGENIQAEAILLTTPAYVTRELVTEVSPGLTRGLQEIRTISSATVSMGFKEDEINYPLDGFGFVVSSKEPTHLVASTWNSTKLAGRAPAGHVLMRVFLGGHRGESDVFLKEDEIIALARAEIKKVMGITAAPVLTRIFRWINANTQYEVGHFERVARYKGYCPPWLLLTGASYDGVGIPDCVRQGRATARQALELV